MSLEGSVADLVWLAILLPFAGFVVNGALAFLRPKAKPLVSAIGVGTVAAAEAAVGLAIIIAIFRHKQTVNLENINLLKG